MNLTRDNYHSQDADDAFCNATQLKALDKCEAAWAARYLLKGADGKPLYPPQPPSEAMLQGLYLECILLEPHRLPELHQQYRNELFTKASRKEAEPVPAQEARVHKVTGKVLEEAKPAVPGDDSKLVLLSAFAQAVQARDFLLKQDFVHRVLEGASVQQIHTGSVAGVPCRTMLDIESPWLGAVDLKYVADTTGREYDTKLKRYVPYWYASGYHLQLALQWLITEVQGVSLLVADKRDPIGLDFLKLEGEWFDKAVLQTEKLVLRWYGLREAGDGFARCGQCEWCRQSAVLGENLSIGDVAMLLDGDGPVAKLLAMAAEELRGAAVPHPEVADLLETVIGKSVAEKPAKAPPPMLPDVLQVETADFSKLPEPGGYWCVYESGCIYCTYSGHNPWARGLLRAYGPMPQLQPVAAQPAPEVADCLPRVDLTQPAKAGGYVVYIAREGWDAPWPMVNGESWGDERNKLVTRAYGPLPEVKP